MFRIEEEDLAELERILPQFQELMFDRIDAKRRTQIRRVQKILSDVRWSYGPPQHVERIPCDDGDQAP